MNPNNRAAAALGRSYDPLGPIRPGGQATGLAPTLLSMSPRRTEKIRQAIE